MTFDKKGFSRVFNEIKAYDNAVWALTQGQGVLLTWFPLKGSCEAVHTAFIGCTSDSNPIDCILDARAVKNALKYAKAEGFCLDDGKIDGVPVTYGGGFDPRRNANAFAERYNEENGGAPKRVLELSGDAYRLAVSDGLKFKGNDLSRLYSMALAFDFFRGDTLVTSVTTDGRKMSAVTHIGERLPDVTEKDVYAVRLDLLPLPKAAFETALLEFAEKFVKVTFDTGFAAVAQLQDGYYPNWPRGLPEAGERWFELDSGIIREEVNKAKHLKERGETMKCRLEFDGNERYKLDVKGFIQDSYAYSSERMRVKFDPEMMFPCLSEGANTRFFQKVPLSACIAFEDSPCEGVERVRRVFMPLQD